MGIFKIKNVFLNLFVDQKILKTQILTQYENNSIICEFLDNKNLSNFNNKNEKNEKISDIISPSIKIENYYECLIEEDFLFPNCDEMYYDYTWFTNFKTNKLKNLLDKSVYKKKFFEKLDLNDDEILKDLLNNQEIISQNFSELYLTNHFEIEKHKKLKSLFRNKMGKFLNRKTKHNEIDDLLNTKYTYNLLDDLTKQELYLFLNEDLDKKQMYVYNEEIYDSFLSSLKNKVEKSKNLNINLIIMELLNDITKYLEQELMEEIEKKLL